MPTSYEVAQVFGQQNQMFMSQNQFAQSISVPMMNQVGFGGPGVGGYGMGGPRGGPFNYGQTGMMGYGPGNAVAGGMMSMAGGIASAAPLALGAAGAFGMLGRAGALMDPIAMGGMAFRGLGGGMLGGMGALAAGAAPLALGMLAQHSVGSMIQGGQQQGMMNTMLGSQYNFFNPMSRTGSGFSRDDAKAIGDMTRHMSHLPEMMSSFEEMSRIMGRMKSSGMMQGVRSAADFQARFREAIGTIKETAKILGTTMEEAEQFFSASRGAGFYGRQSQLKNVMNAQFTSAVTGASVGQVMSAQGAGADMAMSMGARRGLGATAVTNIAQNIGLAQAAGNLREGAVEDATGLQGPEGQLALAQKMYGGMMNFGRTAAGRLAMAGMMKFEGDRAVGVDSELVKRFNRGELSIDELKSRAGRLTNAQKISYTARQSDLVSSLAGQVGPGGAYQMMKGALGDRYGTDEATNLVMQRLTGMSAGEIDIAQGMNGVSGEGEQGMMSRMRMRQSSERERTDPSAIWKKIKTRMHSATFGKLEQVGANIQKSIAKGVDDFFDDLVGREVSTLTEERAKAISNAFAGSNSSEAKKFLAGLTKTGGGAGGSSFKMPTAGEFAKRAGLSMMTMGLSNVAYSLSDTAKQFGGAESGVSRFITGLTGGMTAGQEGDVAAKMFGTRDAGKQSAMAALFAKGGMAGSGAQGAIGDILAENEDFSSKSGAQQADIVTSGLESAVRAAAKKGNLGFAGLKNMSEETIDNSPSLSKKEKSLLKSYINASKNSVGGNTFAQMAAASGAGKMFSGMAGKSLPAFTKESQNELKAARGDLESLGEGVAGFVDAGGSKAANLLKKLSGNQEAMNALMMGDSLKAVELMGGNASVKDITAAGELVRGFQGKDPEKVKAMLERYSKASDMVASGEFRSGMVKYGSGLSETAGSGKAGDAQRALGNAMAALGQDGSEASRDAYDKAFKDYSTTLGGLSGKELEAALEAGGSSAQVAYSAGRKRKKKSFSSFDEMAKEFGIDKADAEAVGSLGKDMTDEQIQKMALKGASRANLMASQGTAKSGSSVQEEMLQTLKNINTSQEKMVTVLSDMNDPLGAKAALSKFMGTGENASAGKDGKTEPGKR